MVYDGALNVAIFSRFLKRLVRDAVRKVFLIVDNLRVHRARIVNGVGEANKNKIELFYLPPYAPIATQTSSSTTISSRPWRAAARPGTKPASSPA